MLSVCRFSLLLLAVCHTDPDCDVACSGPLHHYESSLFCQKLKFIMILALHFVPLLPLEGNLIHRRKKSDGYFNSVWSVQKVTDLISTGQDFVLIVLMSHTAVKDQPNQTSVEYKYIMCCKLKQLSLSQSLRLGSWMLHTLGCLIMTNQDSEQ